MMDDEPLPRIAVLGAGPIGLEAALYARYLGYPVNVYERGEVAASVLRWGHVRLFSPFGMNRSTLGRAALAAQGDGCQPPADDAVLSAREWAERYLLPLSRSDLLAECISERTEVLAVARRGALKTELVNDPRRGESPFVLLLARGEGDERTAEADVVIDATGVYGCHNWLGSGGLPAVGEREAGRHIEYGLPDVLGTDRDRYAGRHTLLVGAGYSAATTAVALAELAREAPGTRLTWITRRLGENGVPGPIRQVPNDRLPARDRLARAANEIAAAGASPITWLPGSSVAAVAWDDGGRQFRVRLEGASERTLECDQLVANVGYRPDARLHAELHVHECYASGAPMKLAAARLARPSADCLDQKPSGGEALKTPEPNYYILGAKSFGRDSSFLVSLGLEQVREAFSLIHGRGDLNLYAGAARLANAR
jgi:thioredoxin reductase